MLAFLLLACDRGYAAVRPAARAARVRPVSPHEALKSGGSSSRFAPVPQAHAGRANRIQFRAVLFVSGLLLLSFRQLTHVDLGFDRSGLLLIDVGPVDTGPFAAMYKPAARIAALQLLDRIRELPGVRNAALLRVRVLFGLD
jgi:hypothetical protein